VQPRVSTTAADNEVLERLKSGDRETWTALIDSRLIEWGRNLAELKRPDFEPPTGEAVRAATVFAFNLRDSNSPPPTHLVPDGEGGISFEFRQGNAVIAIDVCADGSAETLEFKDCRLVQRKQLGNRV
jgi:hypothetical protein